MVIIPAIDIRKGRCVSLAQGNPREEILFSKEPLSIAKLWKLKGAAKLHIIDIDGAMSGSLKNFDIVKKIAKAVKVPIQFGGGIRSLEDLKEVLEEGVEQVIISTVVLENSELFKKMLEKYRNKIIVGVDAMDGHIAIDGWKKTTSKRLTSFLKELEEEGVKSILFTDIKKVGMLGGPNFKTIKELAQTAKMDITVRGGVAVIEHIENLCALGKYGIDGIVIGKALYKGKIDLKEAIEIGNRTTDRRHRKLRLKRKLKRTKK